MAIFPATLADSTHPVDHMADALSYFMRQETDIHVIRALNQYAAEEMLVPLNEEGKFDPVPVDGYRPLDVDEIDAMNQLKLFEAVLLRKIDELRHNPANQGDTNRCLALAKTNVQQGVMWACRAVARPIERPQEG